MRRVRNLSEHAQQTPDHSGNAAISGTITDSRGAVLAGAKVMVTQKSTSITRTVTTNGSGQFNIPSLPPATYTVSVEASGFKQYLQDVVLLADQIHNMAVPLEVGETSQRVTVEASGVQVNTVSPVLSQVIDQSRVINLPLNGKVLPDASLAGPSPDPAASRQRNVMAQNKSWRAVNLRLPGDFSRTTSGA